MADSPKGLEQSGGSVQSKGSIGISPASKGTLAIAVVVIVVLAVLFATGILRIGVSDTQTEDDTTDDDQDSPAEILEYGSVLVTLADEETQTPIGRVSDGYCAVYIDGVEMGYLSDSGQILVSDLLVGYRHVTITVPGYGEVREIVEIEADSTTTASLQFDMPNPVFITSVDIHQNWYVLWESLDITIEVLNTGTASSERTKAIVFVFNEDDYAMSSKIVDIGTLSTQESDSAVVTFDTDPWKAEYVAVAVLDGWAYTPGYEEPIVLAAIDVNPLNEVIGSVLQYLADNPDQTLGLIQILVGWMG